MRIISLVPSVTETLSAWGRAPVACTRFCERPDLPHIGGTKDPDTGAIADLEPDLIVVDAEENRREDYEDLLTRGLAVHVLRIRSLDDVSASMAILADRVDARWIPPVLGCRIPRRIRAFVPIWRRPWMALGSPTYGASLLSHLGMSIEFSDRGPYPTVCLEEATNRRPDVVLAPSEPYPFTKRQLPELESVAPTVFIDGKDLFWWGVRSEGATKRLGGLLAGL